MLSCCLARRVLHGWRSYRLHRACSGVMGQRLGRSCWHPQVFRYVLVPATAIRTVAIEYPHALTDLLQLSKPASWQVLVLDVDGTLYDQSTSVEHQVKKKRGNISHFKTRRRQEDRWQAELEIAR